MISGDRLPGGRTVVGASAPDGHAVVGLELVGKGSDPEAALRAYQQNAKIDLAPGAERLMVGGLPAIHATSRPIRPSRSTHVRYPSGHVVPELHGARVGAHPDHFG